MPLSRMYIQEGLAVASIARDDPPLFPACTATTMHPHALQARAVHAGALWAATAMRGKFGSEFEI